MRTIGSRAVISDAGQLAAGVIVNAAVNAAAAIEFSKLDSANVDADLAPDVASTRTLGTAAKPFATIYAASHYDANGTDLKLWAVASGD